MSKNELRLAVVGSRSFDNYSFMELVLSKFPHFILVSGGAEGADKLAERYAKENDLEVIIHKPEWKLYKRKAGMVRNTFIVRDCNAVVAFWDEKSKETKMIIDLAKKQKKLVYIQQF